MEGRAITLHGVTTSEMDVIDGKLLGKLLQVKSVAHLLDLVGEAMESTIEVYLEALQSEFEDVFASPQGLPPLRACDHKIPLQNPHLTINARPYHHLFH